MQTYKIVNAFELRDLAQQAVRDSRAPVKIEYPFSTGGQIDVKYSDVKDLFAFAMAWGVLLWQLKSQARMALRKSVECSFFICANCSKIGKEHRHKVFTNLCNDCGKTTEETQNARTVEFWRAFDGRNKPKFEPLPEVMPEEKPPPMLIDRGKLVSPVKLKRHTATETNEKPKEYLKLVNPVKLKHKK